MRERVADGTIAYDAYLRDETGEAADAYGAVCTPDPFLFGRDGDAFRLQYHGRLDDALNPDDEPTEFYIRDAVDAVLAGEEVEVPDRPREAVRSSGRMSEVGRSAALLSE